ncbi:inactive protein RESTRICTED TEV MOVEMENT 2-like [Durio zibethinus]|uniref:Inactive protein RESTRICTED TEV MOVEMENT 2-like n=1 Tax=Durio zibethinus TaxID=66656 RepID=A0A6P5Y6C1_DURZI|nr:inactive protein RESTRICTED TEV MOVEMENT 2-like [Durio zibethinus]
MANLGDRRPSGEKFVPASDWTQDAKAHYLFVDLPGFKKEQLKLELASTGHITISGEKIVDENKRIYFEQTFALPENSDMENISGKFDGDFLHVTVPRKSVVEEENKQQESGNGNSNSIGEKISAQEEPNKHGENQSEHEEGHGDLHERCCDDEAKGEMISNETCRVAGFPKEMIRKWEQEDGPLEMAMKFLKKNKGVILSVVIAFSIGVLVYRTFESGGE